MSETRLFIDDGYTLDSEVKERPGIHPGLKFSYRPALAEAVYQYGRVEPKDGKAAAERNALFLVQHLVTWDATEPISVANLKRLHHRMIDDLIGWVSGYREADAKN